MGILLILEGPAFPLVWAVKLLAVLVLLLVSAVSVVVALKVVPAKARRQKKKANSTMRSCFRRRTRTPNPESPTNHEPGIQIEQTCSGAKRFLRSLLLIIRNPYPRKALACPMIYLSELRKMSGQCRLRDQDTSQSSWAGARLKAGQSSCSGQRPSQNLLLNSWRT